MSSWTRNLESVSAFTSMRGGAKSSTWKFILASGSSSLPGTTRESVHKPVRAFEGRESVKGAPPSSSRSTVS